jgi:hypothetical protein
MNELNFDPRCTAVIVIDIQKGIVAMAAGAPHPTSSVVANCVNLLTAGRRAGAHPVLVHVGGSPSGSDFLHPVADEPMRGTAALPPDWSDLLPELGSNPTDTVILKRQWGSFLRHRSRPSIAATGAYDHHPVRHCDRVWGGKHRPRCVRARIRTGVRRGRHDRTHAESHANAITRISPA